MHDRRAVVFAIAKLLVSVLSRPRRDRDVPEKRLETAVRSLKTLTGEVCHLTTCFLRVRSVIFFLIYPKARCIARMFTRIKLTKPEIETLYPQDREDTKTFDFSNVSRPPRNRDVQYPGYIPASSWHAPIAKAVRTSCVVMTYRIIAGVHLH